MKLKRVVYKFLSLVNYYFLPANLNLRDNTVYQAGYYVTFTEAEIEFLKQSALTFNFNPDYSSGYLQKPLYTTELVNVSFLGNSGALVVDNKLLAESAFDQLRMSISPAYRFPALMWNRQKKGFYTSIMHLPWAQKSNYHWFFDCLPRLFLLIKQVKEPITLIVNADIPAFQRETLDLLLADSPNFKIALIQKNAKWTVDRFMYASFVTNHNSGYLPEEISRFLRDKIWSGYGVTQEETGACLYISRRKASKRKIVNEPELEPILLQNQFKIIYAEDLSYQEQVKLFYGATHVVAPHGAGLTNILFSRKCAVLEMHASDIIKPHYFLAAKSLGHKYDYLIGSESDEKFNFSVDTALFAQKLRSFVSGEGN